MLNYCKCLQINSTFFQGITARLRSETTLPTKWIVARVQTGTAIGANSAPHHLALELLRWSWLLSQMMEHGSGPVGRIGVRTDFLSWPLYGGVLQSGRQHLDARGEAAGPPIV